MIPVSKGSGGFQIQAGQIEGEVSIQAALLKGEETLASAQLVIATHEKFELSAAGGQVSAQGGRVKIRFDPETLTGETVTSLAPGLPTGARRRPRGLHLLP